MPLLTVAGLSVEYQVGKADMRAVHNANFAIEPGEVVGLVGESGSGKSTIGKAILRLLPANGRITHGQVLFRGRDLVQLPYAELRRLRWSQISVVFQSSMNALNPVYSIGHQIAEAIRIHEPGVTQRAALDRARGLLSSVEIDPGRWSAYPHQLSGGMRQRVNIAMAMALSPSLIIADEPTTALDVVTQDKVLRELRRQQQANQNSMLLITHDIACIAENCQRVAVMYAGTIVEFAPVATIFSNAFHPYTLGLQNAFPDFRSRRPLVSIPGFPPTGAERGAGCAFAGRCPFARNLCTQKTPTLVEVGSEHQVSCHFSDEAAEFQRLARDPATWTRKTG